MRDFIGAFVMKLPRWFAAGSFAAVLAGATALFASVPLIPANADTAPPHRIHGTIDKIDDGSLDLTTRGGEKMSFKLLPTTSVIGIAKTSTSDIKPGSYVGTAAMPQADGTLAALEVHIFPP